MKKLLKKVISLTAALAMAAAYSATATVTTGGGTDSKPYYWLEDFNDYTNTTESATNFPTGFQSSGSWAKTGNAYQGSTAAHSYSDSNHALKASMTGGTANSSNSFVYVNTGKKIGELLNGGDVVVSYNVMFPTQSARYFRTEYVLNNSTGTIVAMAPKFNGSNSVQFYSDYISGSLAYGPSTISAPAVNTSQTVTVSLHKNNDGTISIKQYLNYKEFAPHSSVAATKKATYTRAALDESLLDYKLILRFYVYSGTTAIIDNVTVRNATTINLPKTSWINISSSTGNYNADISYTNTPDYTNDSGETVSLDQGIINKLSVNMSDTGSSKITLNKYNLESDPLLLNPTSQAVKISYSNSAGFGITGVTVEDTKSDFYIAKLNDTSDFTSVTGQATENEYVLLHRGLTSAPIIRQTKLYGEGDEVLTLENGKLPQETQKIETVISYYSDVPETVKITGKGVNVSAAAEGKICTIDLSESPLLPGEDYTITIGTASKTYTATGEKVKMDEAIETFGDSPSVTDEVCASNYITLDRSGNNLLYQNTLTSGTANATYKFQHPFNFEGGSKKMLVSFKVKLNQTIAYNSTESQSHLLLPNVKIGSKTVYMPAIEHSGFRARKTDGGRNTNRPAVWEYSEMQQDRFYTESVLVEYDAVNSKLTYTQYINGKSLEIKNSTTEEVSAVGAFEIADVTEDDLNKDIEILFQGRNFAGGGLYIDDLAVTTVDGSFNVSQPVISEDNTVTVNAVNKTENIKPMYIILASYNGAELLDVEYKGVDINFTERQYQIVPSEEFNTTGATAIKAFVWNGFAGATPYAANAVK